MGSEMCIRDRFRSFRARLCDGAVKRALAAPCAALAQRAVTRRRARAAASWDEDQGDQAVDDSDARAVLEDVASVARARPSAVDSALLAAIRDALKTFYPAALAAFDGTAAAPAARSSSFGGRRISLGPSPE